jgi:hypothetical protein
LPIFRPSVRSDDERKVSVSRDGKAESPAKGDLPRRGREKVRPANDLGDTLERVVHDDGELIGVRAVSALQDEVPDPVRLEEGLAVPLQPVSLEGAENPRGCVRDDALGVEVFHPHEPAAAGRAREEPRPHCRHQASQMERSRWRGGEAADGPRHCPKFLQPGGRGDGVRFDSRYRRMRADSCSVSFALDDISSIRFGQPSSLISLGAYRRWQPPHLAR